MKPMPVWLRKRVVAFFLGMAALVTAMNGAVLLVAPPDMVAVSIAVYVFAAIGAFCILAAIYFNHAPVVSDEEFERQRRERR